MKFISGGCRFIRWGNVIRTGLRPRLLVLKFPSLLKSPFITRKFVSGSLLRVKSFEAELISVGALGRMTIPGRPRLWGRLPILLLEKIGMVLGRRLTLKRLLKPFQK